MTFIIHTHGRLQEWIADAKGYFTAEGLDYRLEQHRLVTKDAAVQPAPAVAIDNREGAFKSYEEGRDASISCACHWTVNMAATAGLGRMWGEAYSVSPCAIFVPPSSAIRRPEDLAGVGVHVGYQSGSHYTTIQALEPFLAPDAIKLTFGGSPTDRVDQLLEGRAPAATLFGIQYYLMEQLGYRKIVDATFMIAGLVPDGVDLALVRKYYRALRRAQADIDHMHQSYTHFYRNELPERHLQQVDVRRFGPGERIVFEPYDRSLFETTRRWVLEREIFPAAKIGHGSFEAAVAV